MSPEILFEDRDLIILNKPSGFLVETDPFGTPNLQDFVTAHCAREIKIKSGPGVVHRLDKPTSGIVIIAKKPSILKKLNEDFAARRVKKWYTAEAAGHPNPPASTLENYLLKDHTQRKAIILQNEAPGAKRAVLSYETLRSGPETTLLRISLETGRYHQIRAQLAYLGHPIIGDTHYGSRIEKDRIHLHASELEFTHPKTRKQIKISSDPLF